VKVQRFFHLRVGNQRNGGATVLVTGDTDKVGTVDVQTAFCSKKDNYCRKTGRDTAKAAPVETVPLRDLSRKLAEIDKTAITRADNWFRKHPQEIGFIGRDFSFATRYFLPR
jgi:1,4-dihydroxy-2-naphthoyl-CoA synthase